MIINLNKKVIIKINIMPILKLIPLWLNDSKNSFTQKEHIWIRD